MNLHEAVVAAQDLFGRSHFAECEALCLQVLKVQNTHFTALYLLGRICEHKGDRQRAAAYYIEGVNVFPYNQEFANRALSVCLPEQVAHIQQLIRAQQATITGFTNKPALKLVATPLGQFALPMFPDNDVITQSITAGRVFEPEIVDVARQYVSRGSTVIDVGANFGQMTLLFSQMVGPQGTVYALEADDYIHHVLTLTVHLNQVRNVVTIPKAVHERSGERVFFPDQDFIQFNTYGSYGIDHKASSGRQVETVTIDSLEIESPISFMKVDVQGCDLFAMRGAIQTIQRHRMPIIFEYEEQFQENFGTSFEDYVQFVRQIGYRFLKTVNSINYLIVPVS
jgi:FkbM family methyltransferase